MANQAKGTAVRRRAWTPREVAAMLRLSKSSVYNMLHTGELYGWRWGKRWVAPSEALDKFLGVSHEVPDDFPEPDSGNGSESARQVGVNPKRPPVAEGIPEEESRGLHDHNRMGNRPDRSDSASLRGP